MQDKLITTNNLFKKNPFNLLDKYLLINNNATRVIAQH